MEEKYKMEEELTKEELKKIKQREWRLANKDKIIEYRLANKEKATEQYKQYYKENRDKILERRKAPTNKEKIAKQRKQYKAKNKDKINAKQKEYREKNKEKLNAMARQYDKKRYEKDKEKILKRVERYRLNNKEKVSECQKQWYLNNKDKVKQYQLANKDRIKQYQLANRDKKLERGKIYYLKNKDKITKRKCQYQKIRRKIDPVFRLRSNVSRLIRGALMKNGGSKIGESILKYLPYSFKELKQHLEKQFEPWMNWDNYGAVNLNKRTWQIDHIEAQSKLIYNTMDHPNFIKCWALENLQPLDAFENIKKSNK